MQETIEAPAAQSLHTLLDRATERKEPTADAGNGWDFSEDLKEETPAADHRENGTATENPAPGKKARVTDEVKKTSAETSTLLFDGVLTMVGSAVLNRKFKKRFTPEEMKIILEQDLEDKALDAVEEANQVLKRKFDRLLKKRDKKLAQIPLSDPEHATVFESFYNYYKAKDIAMPPELLLGFTLGSIIVDRTLEVTLD